MKVHRYQPGSIHLIRADAGDDLVGFITRYAADNGIKAAWFTYLGAVRFASLRYYDQISREYRDFTIDQRLEILSGVGNVSLLHGEPFVHTHAVLADADGHAFGGHVNTGSIVWALEIRLEEFSGDPPARLFDEPTGLSLWGDDGPEA